MKRQELHKLCCGVIALSVAFTVPEISFAQSGRGGEGFLFETPKFSFAFSLGYSIPNAKSEIFDFAQEQLTLEKSDFHRSYLGGEAAIQLSDRLDLVFGVGHAESSLPSEFRDWVDGDDLPIEQETIFSTTPVTVSAKYYLSDRGRQIGRFAWIPKRLVPFMGVGGGVIWYNFEQVGDFVDFETLDIFYDRFMGKGTAIQAHAFAGMDISLNKSLFLTTEGRYRWGRGELGRDFVDFDKMDLAGIQFTVSIGARF